MENNGYSGHVLILSRELWAKTWQQSLSQLTKQPKTAIFDNRPIVHWKLSIECMPMYALCMPMDCVSVDNLLCPVAK